MFFVLKGLLFELETIYFNTLIRLMEEYNNDFQDFAKKWLTKKK